MSSIVNKSATRFAPKVQQRRAPQPVVRATSIPSEPEPVIEEEDEDEEDVGPTQIVSSKLTEANLNQQNTQPRPRMDSVSSQSKRRMSVTESRSSSRRLSSISNGISGPRNLEPQQRPVKRMRQYANLSQPVGNVSQSRPISSGSAISISQPIMMTEMTPSKSPSPLDTQLLETKHKIVVASLKDIPKGVDTQDSENYIIDEERMTMADLCKPLLPIGEISENFHRALEADRKKKQKREERRMLRDKARMEGTPLADLQTDKEERERLEAERKRIAEELLNNPEAALENSQQQAIQLKMNADGTIAIDEESRVVDRHANASQGNMLKEREDQNPFENLYNTATYGRQRYTDPWTSSEMVTFYKALSMWGTDFNLIAQLFPYRTRRQVKAKFILEEKRHPFAVELALTNRLPPDFEEYSRGIKVELGTVGEFNEKLVQLQREHEEHLKQIEIAKEKAKQEDIDNQKNRKELNTKGYRREVVEELRKKEIVLGTIDDIKRKREAVSAGEGI